MGINTVGMMHEIVRARMALTPVLEKIGLPSQKADENPRSAYVLKRHAVHHSLYGVDVDPGAVEIAKLRLWLSMVVDEDEISDIQPLPNLDYKIMQGNSLLEEFDGVRLFDEGLLQEEDDNHQNPRIVEIEKRQREVQEKVRHLEAEGKLTHKKAIDLKMEAGLLAKESKSLMNTSAKKGSNHPVLALGSRGSLKRIQQLHAEFFDESSRIKKEKLREELERLEWDFMRATLREQGREQALVELEKASAKHSKPFFLWRWHFAEVFKQHNGFDIVIANPPFVVVQGENRDEKLYAAFKRLYEVASYKIDLYHIFIERGVQLLRVGGAICFITPSNFVSNNYSVGLRKYLLNQTLLDQLVYFDEQVFEASVHNLVFAARKGILQSNQVGFYKAFVKDNDLTVKEIYKVEQQNLITKQSFLILRENLAAQAILESMDIGNVRLSDVADINFGMQLRDRSKFTDDVIEKPSNKDMLTKFHKPCYTGKDISRFNVRFQERYCYFNTIAKRGGCWDESLHSAKEKILVRQIGLFPEGGIDRDGYAVLNTAFMIVPKGKEASSGYILALINSSAYRFYWLNRFGDGRKTFPKIKGEYLKLLPLPSADASQKATVELIVEYLIWLNQNRVASGGVAEESGVTLLTGYFEQLMNALVYELFFPNQLHRTGLYFFSIADAAKLRPLSDVKGREIAELRAKFEELYASNHPLRQGLFALDSIEEVRIIEGKA